MNDMALIKCLTLATPPNSLVFVQNAQAVNEYALFFEFYCRVQGSAVISPHEKPKDFQTFGRWQLGDLPSAINEAEKQNKPLVLYEYPWLLVTLFADAIRRLDGKKVRLCPASPAIDYHRKRHDLSSHTEEDLALIGHYLP
jgi:hypothetical protein